MKNLLRLLLISAFLLAGLNACSSRLVVSPEAVQTSYADLIKDESMKPLQARIGEAAFKAFVVTQTINAYAGPVFMEESDEAQRLFAQLVDVAKYIDYFEYLIHKIEVAIAEHLYSDVKELVEIYEQSVLDAADQLRPLMKQIDEYQEKKKMNKEGF